MDFSLTDEQRMLQESVSRFVSKDYDFEKRRRIVDTGKGYDENNWQLFAELGWLMVPFKEEDGGLGGSAVDLILLMEEFGKGLVNEPFLATAIMAGGVIAQAGSEQQKAELLEAIMGGELQLALAYSESQSRYDLADIQTSAKAEGEGFVLNGHKSVVLNGRFADKLLITARTSGAQTDKSGISLFIVDADTPGVTREGYPTVDGHQGADIWFNEVKLDSAQLIGELGSAYAAIECAIERATLAVCAEAVGAMSVATDKTVEYSKTRKQFNREIGSFQALQHRMANMFIEVEQAKSILLMAALKMDVSETGLDAKALSAAKSRIGKAARLVSQESVQIHGGIGMTDELDIGHLFKRLSTIQYLFGSTDWHTRRFANL